MEEEEEAEEREEEKWKRRAEGERRDAIQQRSKGEEDGGLQVHGINFHLGSHMMPPLHKAYKKRQTGEQTDQDRRGEEGNETGSVSGRKGGEINRRKDKNKWLV